MKTESSLRGAGWLTVDETEPVVATLVDLANVLNKHGLEINTPVTFRTAHLNKNFNLNISIANTIKLLTFIVKDKELHPKLNSADVLFQVMDFYRVVSHRLNENISPNVVEAGVEFEVTVIKTLNWEPDKGYCWVFIWDFKNAEQGVFLHTSIS